MLGYCGILCLQRSKNTLVPRQFLRNCRHEHQLQINRQASSEVLPGSEEIRTLCILSSQHLPRVFRLLPEWLGEQTQFTSTANSTDGLPPIPPAALADWNMFSLGVPIRRGSGYDLIVNLWRCSPSAVSMMLPSKPAPLPSQGFLLLNWSPLYVSLPTLLLGVC